MPDLTLMRVSSNNSLAQYERNHCQSQVGLDN